MCDIQLDSYDENEISTPGVISSGGLGPCIAIGIYDKAKKVGYMRHQPNAHHDSDMEKFVERVINESDVKDLTVWVCGGSYNGVKDETDREVNEDLKESRNCVTKIIERHFSSKQYELRWAEPEVISELILRTATGKFEIVSEEIGE